LRAKECTEKINLEVAPDVRGGDFLEGLRPIDGGAVDQHIEPPESLVCAADEVANGRFLGQVGLQRDRFDSAAAAQALDRLCCCFR
jgi:hypothetical protein